jgi:hypothetical protein
MVTSLEQIRGSPVGGSGRIRGVDIIETSVF